MEDGHLVVKRGEGTSVAEAPLTLKLRDRGRLLAEGALRFATLAVTSGAEWDEARGALDKGLESLKAWFRRIQGTANQNETGQSELAPLSFSHSAYATEATVSRFSESTFASLKGMSVTRPSRKGAKGLG